MNYLDTSNQLLYLWVQLLTSSYEDYEIYSRPDFPNLMDPEQKDLTFGQFKTNH